MGRYGKSAEVRLSIQNRATPNVRAAPHAGLTWDVVFDRHVAIVKGRRHSWHGSAPRVRECTCILVLFPAPSMDRERGKKPCTHCHPKHTFCERPRQCTSGGASVKSVRRSDVKGSSRSRHMPEGIDADHIPLLVWQPKRREAAVFAGGSRFSVRRQKPGDFGDPATRLHH